MITYETIEKIEKTFDIKLYNFQKDYLLGMSNHLGYMRASGRTFAYMLRLLLEDGEEIPFREVRSGNYNDGHYGSEYKRWFSRELYELNLKLIKAGFKTRLNIKK